MTDKQFRFARTSQCYCLGQRENACSKANCTHPKRLAVGLGVMKDWLERRRSMSIGHFAHDTDKVADAGGPIGDER